jgi:hypothetical protein
MVRGLVPWRFLMWQAVVIPARRFSWLNAESVLPKDGKSCKVCLIGTSFDTGNALGERIRYAGLRELVFARACRDAKRAEEIGRESW